MLTLILVLAAVACTMVGYVVGVLVGIYTERHPR